MALPALVSQLRRVTAADLVPPLLRHRAARYGWLGRTTLYPTYKAALAACGEGYSAPDLVNVVVEKTRRFRDNLLTAPSTSVLGYEQTRLLYALTTALEGRDELSVIDFGGACGTAYWWAKRLLPTVRWHWAVVETAAMATAGQQHFGCEELTFADTLTGLTADFLLSSSALQYLPDPIAALQSLIAGRGRYLYLTRLLLAEDSATDLVTVQRSMLSENGPGPMPPGIPDRELRYPRVAVSRVKLEAALERQTLLRLTWDEEQSFIGRHRAVSRGYLAQLK